MPFNTTQLYTQVLELFGGLLAECDPSMAPEGSSPACQDVEYDVGDVHTRRGLLAVLSGLSGNVNYTKTYRMPTQEVRTLVLDGAGNFSYESLNNPGVLIPIGTGPVEPGYADSTSVFGREYIAFSDGQWGLDIPRQYDGTNFDRVSQCGPGQGPTASPFGLTAAIVASPGGAIMAGATIAASPGGIVASSPVYYYDEFGDQGPLLGYSTIDVTTTTAHGLAVGQNVQLTGTSKVGGGNFNGTYTVAVVVSAQIFRVAFYSNALGCTGGAGTASNFTVTINTTAAHGLTVGQNAIVQGVAVNGYNGSWSVTSVPSATSFTYTNTVSALAASGNGTVVVGGHIGAGTHKIAVAFQTRQGYITTPSPFTTWISPSVTAQQTGTGIPAATVLKTGCQLDFTDGTNPFVYTATAGDNLSNLVTDINATNFFTAALNGDVLTINAINIAATILITLNSLTDNATSLLLETFAATGLASAASVNNIPIGPSNVIARVLLFTPANSSFFFYIPIPTTGSSTGTVLNDNLSTQMTVDFSDITLMAATSADTAGNNLFALEELGECLGVFSYASRTVWWGERNKVQNALNLTFDGGFTNAGSNPSSPSGQLPNYPLGWTPDPTYAPGGASAIRQGHPVIWGDAYVIVGNGATAIRGLMKQSMYQDQNQAPILFPNTSYSIRARVNRQLNQGTLHINLQSTLDSILTTGLQLTVAQTTTKYVEYTAVLLPTPGFVNIPTDLVLQIYVDGTPSLGGAFIVDCIEIFPTNQPYLGQQLRLSYVENPESFDGVTGLIGLAEAGSENIKRVFQLRENLYIQTDGGIYVTADNGTTEPSGWSINKIASTTGTGSVHGGDTGEEWDISAHKSGLYMFMGSDPMKVNQEIFRSISGATVAWDQINWDYDYTIWVANDVARRQIFIGVPIGETTSPNVVLMMDYKELQTSWAIAEQGPIHTSYMGKVISWEPGRKWSPWSMSMNCGAMILRPDNTWHLFMGNGTGTGKVYTPTEGQYSDDGAAINSFYNTYMIPSQLIAQQNPLLGTNRQLFSLLTGFFTGAGTLNVTAYPLSLSNPGPTYSVLLSATPTEDLEIPIRVAGERCSFRVGTNAVGSWWKMSRFGARLRSHPWSRIRHVN